MQEDPIGVAGGINLYQFNGNDPVTFTDPYGLSPQEGVPLLPLLAVAGAAYVGYKLIKGAVALSKKVQEANAAAAAVTAAEVGEDLEGAENAMRQYNAARAGAAREGGKLATDAVSASWTQGAQRITKTTLPKGPPQQTLPTIPAQQAVEEPPHAP